MRRLVRPLLVVGGIALVVGLVLASGVTEWVRDEEQLRSTVDDAGALGPVLFLGLMVLLVPLNVPGVLFVLPATTLFGTAGGVLLSLVGGFAASVVGVVAARRLGRPVFESRLPDRVRRMEERLSARGFWAVVAARSCTYLLQPVDWLCGLSSIPMRTVLAGTFVGLIPPTLVLTLGGGGLLDRVI
jgi:uncharacterized membrane protein YdjX (TVP38/TMEM64 family)